MSHLTSKVEDLHLQLDSKQGEIEKIADKLCETEQAINSARQEAKINAETTLSLKDNLRRTKLQNEQLDTKLRETSDHLADSQISHHNIQTTNSILQVGE